MRPTLASLVTLAFVASGCHCGQKLSALAPHLAVIKPTTQVGGIWQIDFGSVQANATVSNTIVIQNQGQLQASITSIALRAGSDPSFSLSATAPAAVAAGSSNTTTVTFSPTHPGSMTGFVDIATDDPKLPSAAVQLNASSQTSQVQVCVEIPADAGWQCNSAQVPGLAIDFGGEQVGAAAVARRVQVRDVGQLGLQYFGTALDALTSPEFSIAPSQAVGPNGLPLPAGTDVEFSIAFAATAPGVVTGSALVRTSDATTPTVTLQLQARGAVSANCHLTVTPASVDFGSVPNNTTADMTVLGVNDGLKPCTLSGLNPAGSTAFSLQASPSLPDPLIPNATFTVDVHYQPSGTSTDTGTLTVVSDDPASPQIVVPLSGTSINPPACLLSATPASLDFGGVIPGDRSINSVTLTASGTDPCTVTSAKIQNGNPSFNTPTIPLLPPMLVFPPPNLFGNPNLGVTYAPTTPGVDVDTLAIKYVAGIGGPTLTLDVPLNARAGSKQLCVVPPHLHFGQVPNGQSKDLTFTMTACGTAAVSVSNMAVEPAGTPFSLSPAPGLPIPLAVGASAPQTVRLVSTGAPVAARVHLVSTDPTFPDQYVTLDTGPEIAPPDAGEILYSWTAGTFSLSGAMDGTIYRTNLQGPPNRTPYYGTQAGQACAGCHAVSPDGRYVALVEYSTSPTMRIVDARTGGSIPVPGTSDGEFPSWRPNVATTPPYQFVYSNGNVLKLASVATGVMGELAGANDPNKVQTQPSWGPNGQIAFVKGNPDPDAGTFAVSGPSDLLLIPEDGGVASVVAGASNNGGDNYYPEFSPNGKYIAFTFSASGQTTRSATDSVIKLVTSDNTGTVLSLPQLNAAGPNSWPTWARDGSFLSFSSTRSGGKGSADVWFAPVDQTSGLDGPATNLAVVNTINFDHIARWAFLPP